MQTQYLSSQSRQEFDKYSKRGLSVMRNKILFKNISVYHMSASNINEGLYINGISASNDAENIFSKCL